MNPTRYQRILWWIFAQCANRLAPRSTSLCANRSTFTYRHDRQEMTLILRDMTKPDGYSREELVGMLATIRSEEARTGWTVPEPSR